MKSHISRFLKHWLVHGTAVAAFICSVCAPSSMAATSQSSGEKLFSPEITCTRFYRYHNKVLALDSSRKKDAEGLKPVLQTNADAMTLLNHYQSSMKSSPWPAYIGTLGVVTAIAGPIAAGEISSGSNVRRRNFRLLFVGLGGGIALGSYFYSQSKMYDNEKTLERAVSVYNSSVPKEDRVQVGFEPADEGIGGQLKTQVPFNIR